MSDVSAGRGPSEGWSHPERIGPYRIVRVIGEGGMGVVYEAEQTEPVKRRVALKTMKLGMDTKEVIRRFEAERQALAVMEHPAIAKVLDAGATDRGRPYFVMELVHGIPVDEYCDGHRFGTRERVELFVGICEGVQHAHQKGLIHRDLKPNNVLVTEVDGRPTPKIIDFGIAKATEASLTRQTVLTRHGEAVGTLAYMSPEQAEMSGMDVDTRSDVYSLGVMLFELITGDVPIDPTRLGTPVFLAHLIHRDLTLPTLSHRLTELEPDQAQQLAALRGTDPAHLRRELSGDLQWIVLKAMEKERERRYETAEALAADLRRYLSDETVDARPPTTAYRLGKFVRRNRVAVTATAATALALVAGSVAATVGFVQAREEARVSLSREVAATAVNRLEGDPELAQLLALRAATIAPTVQAEDALDRALDSRLLLNVAFGAFRPGGGDLSPDGRRMIAPLADAGEAGIWNTSTGERALVLGGHHGPVIDAAFAPDGRLAATVGADGSVRVWDAATGSGIAVIEGEEDEIFLNVTFSDDGELLAAGGSGGAAVVWDVRTGEEVARLTGHDGRIMAVAFAPDGRGLGTAGVDGTVRTWDLGTARQTRTFQVPGRALAVAFSPDGTVAGAGMDGSVLLWDRRSGEQIRSFAGGPSAVLALDFSSDGRLLATGGAEAAVRWIPSGVPLVTLRGHPNGIVDIAFSADGAVVATIGADGTARVWDMATGAALRRLRHGPREVWDLAYVGRRSTLVSVSLDGTAKVWDDRSGVEGVTFSEHRGAIRGVAAEPAGEWVVTGGADSTARVWDPDSGRERLVLRGHRGPVVAVAVRGDGEEIATASDSIRLWDAASGTRGATLPGTAASLAYGPDGSWLAVGGPRGSVRKVDARTGAGLWTSSAAHEDRVNGIAVSPDGTRIATASSDATAALWDAATGELVVRLVGHRNRVYGVAFSPDGQRLVTTAGNGEGKVWNVASGVEILTLDGHVGVSFAAAFSPDGRRIATSSSAGEILVFPHGIEELAEKLRQRVRRPLTDQECRRYLHREGC